MKTFVNTIELNWLKSFQFKSFSTSSTNNNTQICEYYNLMLSI